MADGNDFVELFLKRKLSGGYAARKLEKTVKGLHNKPILLKAEKSVAVSGKKRAKSKGGKRGGSSKVLRRRITPVVSETYADYEALRRLWKEYIAELVRPCESSKHRASSPPPQKPERINFQLVQDLLLKADFTGADVSVINAKCKSCIGIEGTVVTETKNLFRLVTRSDTVRCVPKKNTVFKFAIAGYQAVLFGDQFCIKPAHRLYKRFKNFVPVLNLV